MCQVEAVSNRYLWECRSVVDFRKENLGGDRTLVSVLDLPAFNWLWVLATMERIPQS